MANWCSTTYSIYSLDKKELQKCFDKLSEQISIKSMDFVDFLETNKLSTSLCNCGSFQGLSKIYESHDGINYFSVYAESKWVPCYAVLSRFVDTFFPSLKTAYIAEEFGCDVYVKYDPDDLMPENFALDEGGCEYFETSQQVFDHIIETYGVTFDKALEHVKKWYPSEARSMSVLDVLIKYVDETCMEGECEGIYLHKVEEISDPYKFDR